MSYLFDFRCAYFYNFWNILEVVKIVSGLVAMVLFVFRTLWVKDTVEEMMNNRGLFEPL